MDITETLLDMKEQIKDAELKKATSTGKLEQLMDDLKKQGFGDVKQADKKLKSMDREMDKLEKELNDGVEQLENDYAWEG